ncbi:hypothetical protein CVT24_006123 [Panaeolus cyanescens]|uniref:Protein-S-isoprenylcysteine O-methyltransferase n=1 Tax=Panaeolus cyanescens TaxID=181874 RepID=A0A409YDR8_9AGAR|nr:hypothetical protein CVT24_006123 [Panaeolus cyanescens]
MMDADDTWKVVLSALSSYLFYRAYNPPHPPMDAKKRDKQVKGAFTSNTSQYFSIMKSHLQLLLGVAEISLIFAKNYPSSSLSTLARSLFLFRNGNPANLHLSTAHVIGGILIIIGGSMRLWAMYTLGRLFSFQVGIQQGHHLITSGPYSIVRHPSYMGMQITHVGYLLWHLSAGSWVRESGLMNSIPGLLVVVAYVAFIVGSAYAITISRMNQEDKMIREGFGKEWEDWAKRVPYKTMPGIY